MPSENKRLFAIRDDLKSFLGQQETDLEDDVKREIGVTEMEEILKELVDVQVDANILKKTQLGVLVNKLKKHEKASETIIETSKVIISSWKKMVQTPYSHSPISEKAPRKIVLPEDAIKSSSSSSSGNDNGNTKLNHANEDKEKEKEPQREDINKPTDEEEMPHVDPVNGSGHPVRDKCAEKLLDALLKDSPKNVNREMALFLARRIEIALFGQSNNSVDPKYQSSIRSKLFNLSNNAKLRQRILFGDLSPESLVEMSASEMANDQRKKQDARIHKENLMDAQAAAPQQSETDQFKCGKCKQRRTKYYQLQTRSADEPMTTFVTCINCGNRWKFC